MNRRTFLKGLSALMTSVYLPSMPSFEVEDNYSYILDDNSHYTLLAHSAGFRRGDIVVTEIKPKVPFENMSLESTINKASGKLKQILMPLIKNENSYYSLTGIDFLYPPQDINLNVSFIPNNKGPYTGKQLEILSSKVNKNYFIPIINRSFALQKFSKKTTQHAFPRSKKDKESVTRERRILPPSWKSINQSDYLLDGYEKPRPIIWESKFGARRSYDGIQTSPHKGIDCKGVKGDKIYASLGGKVDLVEQKFFFMGDVMVIDSGLGVHTIYAHMSKQQAKVGDIVQPGDIIGEVGMSGRVTGPHLHWQVKYQSMNINPSSFKILNNLFK